MDDKTFDRGQKVRMQLDQMINQFSTMDVPMPLTWLYVWDVVKSTYADMQYDAEWSKANPEKSIDDVWNALWADPRFTLEYGLEQLDEEIRDWLIDNDFIIMSDGEEEDEDE